MSENFINPDERIESIYFGGGTPSLLSADELDPLINTLNKKFNIDKNAEITLEANPDDINRTILKSWITAGINRLSLGVQSFNDEELRWMNRAHTAAESLKSIDEIQSSGIYNFSVDLIFGSPLLSDDELEKNLQIIFQKNIPHISCYALTVEPKTALNSLIEQNRTWPVNPEKQAGQFLLLMDAMKKQQYEQYEISNYAIAGMRSKHNSSYWQGKPYYGFGPSAHSFDGKHKRRWNIANNALYIQSIRQGRVPFEEEILGPSQKYNEYIMTALRKVEGIDLKVASLKFGIDATEKLKKEVQKYIDTQKIFMNEDRIVLTREGKLFADGISADLFI